MYKSIHSVLIGAGALSLTLFAGCASDKQAGRLPVQMDPSERGFVAGTGVESQDLVQVTDKMARSLIAIPQIANAKNPPVIGLLPVENNTRFPIQKDIFNERLKVLLQSRCAGKVVFVARDSVEAIKKEKSMKAAGEVTHSGEKALLGIDFFLTGKLSGMSSASSAGRSDYVLYTYRLIDAENSAEVWGDFSEIKKQGLEDAAYR